MNKIKTTMRIAVIAVFVIVATFATTKPAHAAKFTLLGGYKYVNAAGGDAATLGYEAIGLHGLKLHFLWSLGQRHSEDRARHLFGFGFGGGVVADKSEQAFSDVSLNYEYIFANGLGISGGLGTIVLASALGGAAGGGVSDLGVRYHLKNGLLFSATVDLHSNPDPLFALLYGVNVGLGYEF